MAFLQAAMMLLPYREVFLLSLTREKETSDAMLAKLREACDCIIPIRDALWAFYREHHLTELP